MKAWWATFVLLLAYTVSYIDRQVLSLMVEPIKASLGLTDFQISLLQGLAFALFYTALGLGFGRFADRANRRNLIIAGILVWSVATASGGLAVGFISLFLARLFVGVGEAALSPAAYSMIADLFPVSRGRSLAVSLYSLGVFLGSALAFIVGGAVAAYARNAWQTVFFVVAAPGVAVAILLSTVREPSRVETSNDAAATAERPSRALYAKLILGYSVISIVTLSLMAWIPASVMRIYGPTPTQTGFAFGTIILVMGVGGMLTSGTLAERTGDPFKITFIGAGALIPFTLALAFASNLTATYFATALIFAGLSAPVALAPAVYNAITPNHLRGQVIAIYLLANSVIGMTIGPSAVAALTNFVFHDDKKVGASLAIVCALASVVGTALLAAARRDYYAVTMKSSTT